MRSTKKKVENKKSPVADAKVYEDLSGCFCNELTKDPWNFWELDIAKTKLNKILNSSLDVICAVDARGKFLHVSAACETVWGYTQDEMIGKPLLDFVHPEDLEKTKAEAARVMDGNDRIHFENRYIRKDGSIVPITWSARWDEKEQIRYGVARDATQKKKDDASLRESEKKYKSLFDNNPMPMYIWDFETLRIVDCNEEVLIQYGYTREEFLSLTIKDIRPEEDFQLIEDAVETEEKYGAIHKKIWRHRKKNGEMMYMDVTGHLMYYNGRRASLVMAYDITAKVLAEEQKGFEKINTEALINNTDDLIWSVNCELKLIAANNAFIREINEMTGITLQAGDNLLITGVFPKEHLMFWKEYYETALSGKPVKKEVYTPGSNNWKESWADISFNPIYKDQDVAGIACYSRNITEKKIAEEQLRCSEARLIAAQEVAKVGSWETDLSCFKTLWSHETYRIFEINPKKFAGTHPDFLQFVHPEDRAKVDAAFVASISSYSINTIEHRIITQDGLIKTVDERWRIIRNEKGEPVTAIGTCQDITARKKADCALKKAYEEKNMVLESIDDGFFAVDNNSLVTYWNRKAEILLGEKREDTIGRNLHEMFASSGSKVFYDNYQKAVRENSTVHFEGFSNRAKKWFAVSAFASDNGLSVYFKDVTEQKEAAERIKESEYRYRSLIEQATDAICIADKEMRIIDVNAHGCQLLGYAKDELINRPITDLFPPEELKATPFRIDELRSGKEVRSERKLLRKDRTIVEVDVSGKIMENGQLVVFARDITVRKKAEESNRFKADLLNTIGQATIATDMNGKINFWNRAAEEIYGWTAGEVIGRNIMEITPAEHTKEQATEIMDKLSKGQSWSGEFSVKRKNGQMFTAYINNSPVYDVHNRLSGIIGVSSDITERKLSEQKLKESHELFNLVSKATNDMVWDWNLVTGEVYRNKEGWRKIFRSTGNETQSGSTLEWDSRIHPDDFDKIRQQVDEIQKAKKDFFEVECRIRRDDDTYAYINDKGYILRDETGRAVRLIGATQDITERKEGELRVAKSEVRFKSLVQNSSDLVSILDDSAYYIYSSTAVKKILGYEPEYMVGKNAFSFIHPDDAVIIKAHFNNRNTTSYIELTPYRYKNANGEWRWLESKITDMRDNPEVQGFVFNSRDVTERKVAEEKIEKLSIIARETVNAVIITDPDEKIIWVNEAFTQITEFEATDVIGKRPGDFLQGPETNPATVRFMRQKIKNLEPFECDVLNYSKYGRKYWLRIQCQPQFDETGKLKYFFALETDITKEKEAEEILKASEERYRYLFDHNPANIFIWDTETLEILEVNKTALEQYGYTREEFLAKNIVEHGVSKNYDKINSFIEATRSKEDFTALTISKHLNKAGEVMYMNIASHRIPYKGRTVILALATNVTEKIFLERLLDEERETRQREVTEAVITAQEDERQEIGRELHDNINQILASSRLYLGLVKTESPEKVAFLEETDNLINTAINEIRNLSHSMISASLNESELIEALEHLIEMTNKGSDIVISIEAAGFAENSISDKLKLAIYRIVQEQFNNILKYAKAGNVVVRLQQVHKQVLLSIKDNGAGFDTNKKPGGVGLLNIKTRASLFNGDMAIISSPGNGCELRVTFN